MNRFVPAMALWLGLSTAAFAQTPTEIVTGSSLPQGVVTSTSSSWGDLSPRNLDPNFWLSADYLIWFTREQRTQQLITSIPNNAVGQGAVSSDQITELYPKRRRIEFDHQSGLRLSGGFTSQRGYGVDATVFALSSVTDGAKFTSPGSPALNRVYFRALDNSVQNLYSALPGEYGGFIQAATDTQTFGADVNFRYDWFRLLVDRNELLLGARYLQVEESLIINDRSDLSGGTVINTVLDAVRTRNKYIGGQVGFAARLANSNGFTLDIVTKAGLGSVRQEVQLFGQNTLTGLPDENTGLYVGQFNRGRYSRDRFAMAGEFGVNLGYNVTSKMRVAIGYNITWLTSVVRPGQSFDDTVNDSGVRFVDMPPVDNSSNRPNFDFGRAAGSFWVQGLNLGVSYVY